jgi:hypothetical protein
LAQDDIGGYHKQSRDSFQKDTPRTPLLPHPDSHTRIPQARTNLNRYHHFCEVPIFETLPLLITALEVHKTWSSSTIETPETETMGTFPKRDNHKNQCKVFQKVHSLLFPRISKESGWHMGIQ